jgi:peptide/nickel transport system permease protein
MSFFKRFARNKGALIGLVILLVVIAAAPSSRRYFYPTSPWRMVTRPFLPPMELDGYWLGTDMLGRDVAAGIMHGARVSLLIGLVSTLTALLIGVPIGALAGYFGGIIDDALMRFTEFFQTIPAFALAIVIVAILQPSLYSIVLAIAIVSWPPVARLVRGEVLSLRSREYVQAAVVIGQSTPRIIFTQVLPNTIAPIIVGLADGGERDPARIRPLVPRPRRPQHDDLGLHDRRGPHPADRGLVDQLLPRRRDLPHRARAQPRRRGAQRRPQSAPLAGGGVMSVLVVEKLTLALPSVADRKHAVSNLDLTIAAGETLCIVGESAPASR